MTRRRYDTTPPQDMREQARADLNRLCPPGRDTYRTRTDMTYYALGWLSGVLKDINEVDDPVTARRIAAARALYDAYQEVQ